VTRTTEEFEQTLPTGVAVGLAVLAGVGTLFLLTGRDMGRMWLALMTVISEGGLAVILFTAAAGYGGLIVRRLAPTDAPKGLVVTTSFGVGLALLWTAVLIIGSTVPGSLSQWLWWPVIAGGMLLAAWQIRHFSAQLHWPSRVNGRQLIWVLIAIAGAIWLALATCPPGTVGGPSGDSYDVLEYHLQVPREYHDAGQISGLQHNAYSYYPSGVETLSLLAMTLRGGPHDGAYAAKFVHGLFAVLAVAAIMSSLRGPSPRGPFAGVLLATTPFVIYLGGMAMVEMASICYLVLACLWLRQWITAPTWRPACLIGVMIGAACATKYLAILFVAAPVVAGMLLVTLLTSNRIATIRHLAPVILLAAVTLSPWLVRNQLLTGNPVFPLATNVLGRGHWSAESEQRWIDGHAPGAHAPVPTPQGWEAAGPPSSRLVLFYDHFLKDQLFGQFCIILTAIALCMLVAAKGATDPWDWALLSIMAVQLALWTWLTRDMPGRFLTPIIAPMVLIVGGLLERISKMRGNPFRMQNIEKRHWGPMGAGVIFTVAAGLNLLAAYDNAKFVAPLNSPDPINGFPVAMLMEYERTNLDLPEEARPMLVGGATPFYMPTGTHYATVFDSHPLVEMIEADLSPQEAMDQLKEMGVTHVLVNWYAIIRLANTYGFPQALAADAMGCFEGTWGFAGPDTERPWRFTAQPSLSVMDRMLPLGVTMAPQSEPTVDENGKPIVGPTIYIMPWASAAETLVDPTATE
jgi:hypothetical protein